MSEARSERVRTAATIVGLLVIVGCSAWLRTPGFTQGGFASHDVAGILYNAMVLERGGLPYVDTLELKAPGSFYLASWWAGAGGRDIAAFQIAANCWALLGLVLVGGLGWRVWGRLGALASAGLYALHDANLDSMDANYVTWANVPQIAGFWLAIEAARASSARWRPSLWLLAGAFAGLATLCKQPNGIVLLAILGVSLWPTSIALGAERPRMTERLLGPGCVLLGFLLAHAPIVVQYLAAGELGSLIDGYFLSRWGLRYIGERQLGLVDAMKEAGLATAHFLGLAVALASFTLGFGAATRTRARAPDDRRVIAWLAIWLGFTLIAASVGFRFYKGYFLAAAAPACLLAAAPIGLLGARCPIRWWARAPALVVATLLVIRQLLTLDVVRKDRAVAHDLGGRQVAAHILANTASDDTIWVWGWHLWDVYPLADRMSASPIYKSLGILTRPNDDTWRRAASPQQWVESEYSAAVLADLDANRPAYIALGSSVPHREFEALHLFLRAHYRRDHRVRIGKLQLWQRRD